MRSLVVEKEGRVRVEQEVEKEEVEGAALLWKLASEAISKTFLSESSDERATST